MSSDPELYKILIAHPEIPKAGLDILNGSEGCKLIVCNNNPPDRSEILSKIKGVHGILWATLEKLNAEILNAAGVQLKSISTMSAGLDAVDIAELRRRKIPLGYTPTVSNEAVADLGIGLMISAARRFHEGRIKIVTGTWGYQRYLWMLGQDIKNSVIGIVGFGNIGAAIAKRLQGFEIAKLLYNCRKESPKAKEFGAHFTKFHDLLKQSDFIFVACPLTDETKDMFNAETFKMMKSNCVFINIARGKIVDLDALYNALKDGKIFSAGLDVMDPEPLPKNHPILKLPNCIITPHLGSATLRTREDMSVIAAHNVLRGLTDEPMLAPAYVLSD